MKIEIFVQQPINQRWEIIDLFEDESINMNFKLKDLNDISKVFSTYSQDFTIPASGNNNKVFNYFFDSKLVRTRERGLNAKIYVNDTLFRTGQIVIKEGQVKNRQLVNYKVEFRTVVAQLKERIGDDKIADVIGDLLNENHSVNWDSHTIYQLIVSLDGNYNKDMLVPLVSNRRVWTYGDGGDNDISVASKGIDRFELRPAIKLRIILDLLIEYYGFNIDFPLKTSEVFNKLYVWLNGKTNDNDDNESRPPITYDFNYNSAWVLSPGGIPTNSKMFFDVTNNNGGMRITDTGTDYKLSRNYIIDYVLTGIKVQETGLPYKGKVTALITHRETNRTTVVDTLDVEGATIITNKIKQTKAGVRTYDVKFVFDEPVESFNISTTISVLHYVGSGYPSNRMSSSNVLSTPADTFNIKFELGEWKVIDLFSSIFKMFNIRVVEDFNNQSMQWLTPNEFYSTGDTIDINKYTDALTYSIVPSTQFKDIQFKHTNEDYFRNKEYKNIVNKEYGSEVYKSEDKSLTESYQVETKFNIMNWFIMRGTNLKTSYGFSKPTSPHQPKTPTIFYNQGYDIIRTDDGAQNVNFRFKIPTSSNLNFTNQLAAYIKFGNQNRDDSTYLNSITYDIDINPSNNEPQLKSLYNNYYKIDIERLYNPNSNYYIFEGYSSLQGIIEFDMRNRLIIEDNVYTIEEASVDITTGKFKYKLLNVLSEFVEENVFPIPSAPQTFFANGGVLKIEGAVNTSDDGSVVDYYEIQYRKQGSTTWLGGLNLTFIPFVSRTWNIDPVTPSGLYDVRCRTVAKYPNTNKSEWVYVYSVNVTNS